MSSEMVIATNNAGKLKELSELLSGLDIKVLPQSHFSVPDIEETGKTFVENAIIKARNAARFTNLPAIADDSGIEVDILAGQPGIYSARYAGERASDAENLQRLIDEVASKGMEKPAARFQCVIVYLRHEGDAAPLIAQGTWHGHIVMEPKGDNGFGYDPVFYVPTHHCTSAELPPEVKNRISHRGQALQELLSKLATLRE